jgi:guanylate kinase
VLDDLYGTPVPDAPPGHDVVLEIDIQGARQVRELHPGSLCVLLVAPSLEVQAARLRARGDAEDHVQRRLELGRAETEQGKVLADHVIVNDDLESAVTQLAAIIEAARSKAAAPSSGTYPSETDPNADDTAAHLKRGPHG